MALDIEKEIKIYWIVGLIVLLIYGLWLFISAEFYYAIMGGGPYFSPVALRIVAALYITWAIILVMLWKELDNWEKIESWMIFSAISNILTLIAQIIGIVVYNFSIVTVLTGMILNIFFAIVSIHIIMQKRK